jgi:outer membrane lipoprotein-sorting protein
MRYLLLLFSFFIITSLHAQKDPLAKTVLDKIGDTVKKSKGIQVSLQLVSKNSKGKKMGTKDIILLMKGEKYLLTQGSTKIICDGVNIYNFDGANTITKSSVIESDQTLSPQKLLSGSYDKDFNYKLLSQDAGKATIELTPIDKRKSFQKVTLVVDKKKLALKSAIIVDKSNNITEVNVSPINYKAKVDEAIFKFNRGDYPKNAEIID